MFSINFYIIFIRGSVRKCGFITLSTESSQTALWEYSSMLHDNLLRKHTLFIIKMDIHFIFLINLFRSDKCE